MSALAWPPKHRMPSRLLLSKPFNPMALYLDTSPESTPVVTFSSVASPLRALPGIGKPPESTSIHFSSPVKSPTTGGIRPGSKPASQQSAVELPLGPLSPQSIPSTVPLSLLQGLSNGLSRRPVDTTQCVGCCFVSRMSKSISVHSGGLFGPAGRLGSVNAPFT